MNHEILNKNSWRGGQDKIVLNFGEFLKEQNLEVGEISTVDEENLNRISGLTENDVCLFIFTRSGSNLTKEEFSLVDKKLIDLQNTLISTQRFMTEEGHPFIIFKPIIN